MKGAVVQFHLRGWWHAGTGRGVMSTLDALVARDADGLPYLPGRSVKGLLRDALAQWEYWQSLQIGEDGTRSGASDALTTTLFGSRWDGGPGQTRYNTQAGALKVSSARVEPELREALRQHAERERLIAGLSAALRSTAVDPERGAALDQSLRAIEVAVPLSLRCEVEGPDEIRCEGHPPGLDWRRALTDAAGFLRAVGAGRHRGLGRVEVSVEIPHG